MVRMLIFFLVFLTVYAAMHLLVFHGMRPLLTGRGRAPLWLGLWMLLMVLAPLLSRLLSRAGLEEVARPLAFLGFTWMGFVFLAFAGFLLLQLWTLLLPLVAGPALAPALKAGRLAASGVLVLALAAGLYGLWEASRLQVERVQLVTDKLPPGVTRVRIAQISDLHLGLMSRDRVLAKTLRLLEEMRPDLLVATGDLVDAQIDHLEELSAPLAAFTPPLGKFAVLGNHEVYAGLQPSTSFIERSGFTLLRNQAVAISNLLTVVGVDDPAVGQRPDEPALLAATDPSRFILLLKHRPQVASAGAFDLQLSGHAHRGQIFPFTLLTAIFYPRQNGLYPLDGGSHLYTSRGTGTWGPPIRFLSPPEITLIEIVRRPPSAPESG
ncbi:MAG: metallophosphoesterase [Desulfuromonadales bacterium]|nr:metallophosphoesterase [Desulfuromonadales bacterium]